MAAISAFFIGLLFGLGLLVAGMANPAKVLAFLDISGLWDPSLMLVMVGGIGVTSIAMLVADRRDTSFLGLPMQLPSNRTLDRRLLVGSAIFGVGWGLAGICPGPALVLLGSARAEGLLFVLAMLIGMLAFEGLELRAREGR